MLVKTKHFGEVNLDEEKVITFPNGILGFEDCKQYTILYDNEKGDTPVISWLQSIEEPALALPVINPLFIKEDYNPVVEDEILNPLGPLEEENVVILLSLTVPSDITKMTVNLKAPFIINSDTKKGCQIVVNNEEYPIKYQVYDILNTKK